MSTRKMPRIVLAGVHSGVGKTTLTAGLIAALTRSGLIVQPFKVGPDYIDPTYHTLAAGGRVCRNLDAWMVPSRRLPALFESACAGADLAVIEGVMGLFDGVDGRDETGSTAQVAKLLDAPVVLILDARAMARSAGALALGYQRFDPEVRLAGYIVNRVAGERHAQMVMEAINEATGLPVLGCLGRDERLNIPERHLGLVPTTEPGLWEEFIGTAAETISAQFDLAGLRRIAESAPAFTPPEARPAFETSAEPRPRLAVARDEAFSFFYADNLELLEAAGAELVFFSPLREPALPERSAGVLLSGGFPEVYAAQLAANTAFLADLRRAHAADMPIYAECGGLMTLTEAIVDGEGRTHRMAGLLPGRTRLTQRLTLGYRRAEAAGESWLFHAGESVPAHEFHYSAWEGRPDDLPPAFRVLPQSAEESARLEGANLGRLWASYIHVHFWSQPALAERFVAACRQAAAEQP